MWDFTLHLYSNTENVEGEASSSTDNMLESIATLLEMLRFTYSETIGKWPIADKAFGINYFMRKQLLKPAFTIIHDTQSKCFLLLIRGTHIINDTLTAATAHWIAKLCTPALLKALNESPDSEVKIVGHSLGGGTAAVLTYILREQKELSSNTCVTFAPGIPFAIVIFAAACMTWELAESGKHFITTIINNSDLVPTLSASSVDDLRSEVAASSWLSDLWDQVEHTKVLKVVHHSATALGSHLKSISVAKDKVAGASAIVRPATSGTQQLLDVNKHITSSVVNDIAEGKLWYELEKELEKQNYILNIRAQVEEAAVEKEITEEENQLIDAAQGSNSITPSHNVDSYRFYPPGKIMHIISAPSSDDSSSNSIEEHVKLYETPRQLYSKLRLSRTMINDHYMPTYRKMIQPLIQQLEKDINVK
ncbi:Sn1-specific diacylglycerol lipase alpha [Glycine soja]